MNWYRIYCGLPFDAKLAAAAKRAGLSRAEMLALWVGLLDHAAAQGGALQDLDLEDIAVTLDLEAGKAEAALLALQGKGLITQNRIARWEKMQGRTSTHRTRAWRARQKQKKTHAPTPIPRRTP